MSKTQGERSRGRRERATCHYTHEPWRIWTPCYERRSHVGFKLIEKSSRVPTTLGGMRETR